MLSALYNEKKFLRSAWHKLVPRGSQEVKGIESIIICVISNKFFPLILQI